MGKGTLEIRCSIARCRSLKIEGVMGARDTQIPSTVMVVMVVILILKSRKTEPRTSSQSPAHSLRSSQHSSVAFLVDVETGPTRLRPSYRWNGRGRGEVERAGDIDIQ